MFSWAATLSFPGFLLLFGLAQLATPGGWLNPLKDGLWRGDFLVLVLRRYTSGVTPCCVGHGETGGPSFSPIKLTRRNPLKDPFDPL